MTKRSSLPYAALVVALVAALVATFGGAAEAKAKAIGKNLVVTKSIKNGAVTGPKLAANAVDGSKVKDGSLTAADLAAGTIPTIPAPSNGKAAAFASTTLIPAGANTSNNFAPFGAYAGSFSAYGAIAPATLSVGDLHAITDIQGPGTSVQLFLVTAPAFGPTFTPVLTCTVTNGTTCTSSQQGTIPAGNVFWAIVSNGPTGPTTTSAAISYTIKVQ